MWAKSEKNVVAENGVLTPRAPRTLNTAAPAYARLAALFDHSDITCLTWRYLGPNHIGARITSSFDPQEDSFTQQEMNQVCPGLFKVLCTYLKTDNDWVPRTAGTALWQHFREPGVCIRINQNREGYLRELLTIRLFDSNTGEIVAKVKMYEIGVQPKYLHQLLRKLDGLLKGDFSKKTDSGWKIKENTRLYMIANEVIKVATLENRWPGFTSRLALGSALGMVEEELARYALSVNEQYSNQKERVALPVIESTLVL